jgi:hypothetical protein
MKQLAFEIKAGQGMKVGEFNTIVKMFFTFDSFKSMKFIEDGETLLEMEFDRPEPKDDDKDK